MYQYNEQLEGDRLLTLLQDTHRVVLSLLRPLQSAVKRSRTPSAQQWTLLAQHVQALSAAEQSGQYAVTFAYASDAHFHIAATLAARLLAMDDEQLDALAAELTDGADAAVALDTGVLELPDGMTLDETERHRLLCALRVMRWLPVMRAALAFLHGCTKHQRTLQAYAASALPSVLLKPERSLLHLDVFDRAHNDLSLLLQARQRKLLGTDALIAVPAPLLSCQPETCVIACVVYRLIKAELVRSGQASGAGMFVPVRFGMQSLGIYGRGDIHADELLRVARQAQDEEGMLSFVTMADVMQVALTPKGWHAFEQMNPAQALEVTWDGSSLSLRSDPGRMPDTALLLAHGLRLEDNGGSSVYAAVRSLRAVNSLPFALVQLIQHFFTPQEPQRFRQLHQAMLASVLPLLQPLVSKLPRTMPLQLSLLQAVLDGPRQDGQHWLAAYVLPLITGLLFFRQDKGLCFAARSDQLYHALAQRFSALGQEEVAAFVRQLRQGRTASMSCWMPTLQAEDGTLCPHTLFFTTGGLAEQAEPAPQDALAAQEMLLYLLSGGQQHKGHAAYAQLRPLPELVPWLSQHLWQRLTCWNRHHPSKQGEPYTPDNPAKGYKKYTMVLATVTLTPGSGHTSGSVRWTQEALPEEEQTTFVLPPPEELLSTAQEWASDRQFKQPYTLTMVYVNEPNGQRAASFHAQTNTITVTLKARLSRSHGSA
ncbi:MAG: hypothetical protein ACI4MJ_05940 [Aristaeellaceae bacterium]